MRAAGAAVARFAALAVVGSPVFFVINRLAVFNTVPRDDYAGYLLWLLGQPGGAFPDSPYCYRVLSMVAATPFMLLPAIPLSNLPPGTDPAWLRATAALSALAYFSLVGLFVLGARLGRVRAGLSGREAAAAGGLLVLLTLYTQITAIDPLAILLIAAGLCGLERPGWFAALLLASVLVNEKVALVLAIWLTLRCVLDGADRRLFLRQWGAAVMAVAVYGAVVRFVPFPGNEYQTTLASLPVTVRENLAAYGTVRGVVLNVLPAVVLFGLGVFAARRGVTAPWFRLTDALMVPAMLGVALVLTHLFQAGRLAMHAAPLFVGPVVAGLRGGGLRDDSKTREPAP